MDPLEKALHWNSPYAFSENRVIDAFELEGAESVLLHGTLMPGIQEPFELKNYYTHLKGLVFEHTGRHDYISGKWNGAGYDPLLRLIAGHNIAVEII
ncbi:hypothetical protein BST91_07450 [Nonlabens tegetincola]|nr:hypothetical protein BST91_07450 [Nonlabens tegetincola]